MPRTFKPGTKFRVVATGLANPKQVSVAGDHLDAMPIEPGDIIEMSRIYHWPDDSAVCYYRVIGLPESGEAAIWLRDLREVTTCECDNETHRVIGCVDQFQRKKPCRS